MKKLLAEHCKRVDESTPRLSADEIRALANQVTMWTVSEKSISREFAFRDFREPMSMANRIAAVAETENHHPDLWISYGKLRVEFSTHKIGGLSRNDFIMAAKVDTLEVR